MSTRGRAFGFTQRSEAASLSHQPPFALSEEPHQWSRCSSTCREGGSEVCTSVSGRQCVGGFTAQRLQRESACTPSSRVFEHTLIVPMNWPTFLCFSRCVSVWERAALMFSWWLYQGHSAGDGCYNKVKPNTKAIGLFNLMNEQTRGIWNRRTWQIRILWASLTLSWMVL